MSTQSPWRSPGKVVPRLKVLLAQHSFQALISALRTEAWAAQGRFWPSIFLEIVSDAEPALAGHAAPASLNDTEGSLRGSLRSCYATSPSSALEERVLSKLRKQRML